MFFCKVTNVVDKVVGYIINGAGLNYINWMKKTFPELNGTPEEGLQSHIKQSKSETEILRMLIMLTGGLIYIIPFSLYQATTEVPFFLDPLSIILPIVFYKIGGYVYLYIEQKIIKKRIRKIVELKYS